MPVQNRPEPYPVGMLVKIHNSAWPRARIVEIRGNLGVGGRRVYRLMLRRKPSPSYIEVPEERIEPLAAPDRDDRSPTSRRHPTGESTAMDQPLIVSDPAIMMGKPVVVGTRITVELILEKLAAGESVEHLIESHPQLTRAAISAALSFAARALRAEVADPVASQSA